MISFSNPTAFSTLPLTLHGLSVKEGDNSIGRFGTGLKYAIAIILRNGGSIRIRRRSAPDLTFSRFPVEFRGAKREGVRLHEGDSTRELSFTTDYGQNWEPWMALRELYANALDEGGRVGGDDETVVEVTGSAFEQAWASRSRWLQSRGDRLAPGVYRTAAPGIFYQGFRVGRFEEMPELGLFFESNLSLSEDRQLAAQYQASERLGAALLGAAASETTLQFFSTLSEQLQTKLVYWSKVSDFALEWASRPGAPLALVAEREKRRQSAGAFTPCALSATQTVQFHKALALVQKIEPAASETDFNFTENIRGARAVYMPRSEKIWIAQIAFSRSVLDLAATLYEEFCHKKYNLDDGRPMQEHLLTTLFTMIEAQE